MSSIKQRVNLLLNRKIIMLDYRWIVVSPSAFNVELVELTSENIEDVIKSLRESGYLVGKSNSDDDAIYFSRSGGMGEPNKTHFGELLVIDGNEWTPLSKKEFNLSDKVIRESIIHRYFSDKPF